MEVVLPRTDLFQFGGSFGQGDGVFLKADDRAGTLWRKGWCQLGEKMVGKGGGRGEGEGQKDLGDRGSLLLDILLVFVRVTLSCARETLAPFLTNLVRCGRVFDAGQ